MLTQTETERLAETIKSHATMRNWGITELARHAGISYEDVRTLWAGRIKKPNYFNVRAMFNALEIDAPEPTYPYIGEISTGCGKMLEEPSEKDDVTYVSAPVYIKNGYVGLADGDSMNKSIKAGAYVLINCDLVLPEECHNRIIVYSLNGVCGCKRFNNLTKELIPESDNPEHERYKILNDDKFQIIGVCVYDYSEL